MVTIVAAVLALISTLLKPLQERNKRIEQMQSILGAVNIESTTKNAEGLFNEYIVDSYVINSSGEKIEEKTVFDVDMKKQLDFIEGIKTLKEGSVESAVSPFKKFLSGFISFEKINKEKINNEVKALKDERELPVYECKNDGEMYYIFPLRGKGLWGPIWGYVSLKSDFNTIYGTNFDHKSETPGLGAEIKETWFEDQFKNKTIFADSKFVSVKVLKGGAKDGDIHAVDAISGGTITSKGLETMIFDCLAGYSDFFNKKMQK